MDKYPVKKVPIREMIRTVLTVIIIGIVPCRVWASQEAGPVVTIVYAASIDHTQHTTGTLQVRGDQSVFHWMKAEYEKDQITIDSGTMNFEVRVPNEQGLHVCKDFETGSMTSSEQSVGRTGNHYVSDRLPEIGWNIKPDTRDILGYSGRKAVGEFRGRNYTIWFAPDIPIANGPWKLGGAPGLILEARDQAGEVVIKAVEISDSSDGDIWDLCRENTGDYLSWKEYTETVRKNYREFIQRVIDNGIFMEVDSVFTIEKFRVYP